MNFKDYKLNHKFQEIDTRDFIHVSSLSSTLLPPNYSLRSKIPFIFDQGKLGSCVSNGVSLSIAYINNNYVSSRLFIYYNGRVNANFDINSDTGLTIRDGCKSVSTNCPCDEINWTYDINKFNVKPSEDAYTKSLPLKDYQYISVQQDVQSIKNAIYENNLVLFGFNIFDNFYNTGYDGIVNLPSPTDTCHGSHCCVICGYDDNKKRFQCVNSWGVLFGNLGFFYLPYKYVLNPNMAHDFWYIKYTSDISPIQNIKRSCCVIN